MSEATQEDTSGVEANCSAAGTNPYATGGGGVTFERRVAVKFLAHLLVGDGASEVGNDRHIVSVAFQRAPDHPVDDLVVRAARTGELTPSLLLALAVRRRPMIVKSDKSTRKLIRAFVRAVIKFPAGGSEHRFALVVAGPQPHAEQLAELTAHASVQMDAPGFFRLMRTQRKFNTGIRKRLHHFENLVGDSLTKLSGGEADEAQVQRRTWELLARLSVSMPRLETPDETDWMAVTNSLFPVARGSDLKGAQRLRDRLVTLTSEYAPKAARVDLNLLRRDAHAWLEPATRRHQLGWLVLDSLDRQALAAVRASITANDGARHVSLDRNTATAKLVAMATDARAVVVSGESGVGKSALVLLGFSANANKDPDNLQALCINLRHISKLPVEFEAILGGPLATILCELSAPQRVLVIDGADAVTEGMDITFRYLVDAAERGDVKVAAVTSVDSKQVVEDILKERFGGHVREYVVSPLTDAEIGVVVETFTELCKLNANPRSRELLRRLVVIDLLVRSGVNGIPLSDADAMHEVWSGLVRRRGMSDRGSPGAREIVLLKLADLALRNVDSDERLNAIRGLDSTALDGLHRDGLLRTSPDNLFMIDPEFTHDEVRRYAVARLLLGDRAPAEKIRKVGAPRWALGAALLACQALLAQSYTAATPLRIRFDALQASFDEIVESGHGARWGDVPGEAMLTIGNPGQVLRDAWPKLREDKDVGLRRLARLVDQRLRNDKGIVDIVAVEPIIELLLEDQAPWQAGEHSQDLLRSWLYAHVDANTAAGHLLRSRLRERLVEYCAAAYRRLAEEQAAAATPTPEQIEKRRWIRKRYPPLATAFRSRRSARRDIPIEVTSPLNLELLALLGPDLGSEGERILRQVAQEAPWNLAPAVEELFTGPALASYGQGLLAQLAEAYYLDDEINGRAYEDGIRSHNARSIGSVPLAAWYRGPFMPLFRKDFCGGVAVLNRLLNHATRIRVQRLTRSLRSGQPHIDGDAGLYPAELVISGERRLFIGDNHVWRWYHGSGVGPYPCFSALQALERVCDQLIKSGIPIRRVVSILLDGCESLAMVSLVVGLLVRHLENVGRMLDPYLTEPLIWNYEFVRVATELSPLKASSQGLVAPERRTWSLREAAMFMVVRANAERATELRALGEKLIANARRHTKPARNHKPTEAEADATESIHQRITQVRAWASSLDRGRYQAQVTLEGLQITATPPEDVVQALQDSNEDLERGRAAMSLLARYSSKFNKQRADSIETDELAADIATARHLLENPPSQIVQSPWDVPTLVAAAALEAHLLRGADLSKEALFFAADTVIRVGQGEVGVSPNESVLTVFPYGAERSAARVIPLLFLPAAGTLRATVGKSFKWAVSERISVVGLKLARAVANEVRLYLARGLDHVWNVPCVESSYCHHKAGLHLTTETMRDCVFGDWDPDARQRSIVVLEEPMAESLANTDDNSIRVFRLDAAIRALGPAAISNICVSNQAHTLLLVVLDAQQRSLLSGNYGGMNDKYCHILASARALLTLAEYDNDAVVYDHINAYADCPALLGALLGALSAAAEETQNRAATARRMWPDIVRHVLALEESGHAPFQDTNVGDRTLAALLPNPTPETEYLYREIQDKPILWWNPSSLQFEVNAWLIRANGKAYCIDQLIKFIRVLAPKEQVEVGLPWLATLVLPDTARIAHRTRWLPNWLVEIRSVAVDAGHSAKWQEIVDALVVEGISELAPYSE